ncbi:hypothetical protein T484DRAFT_1597709, partial [Baffinella frigidus]
CTYGTYPNPDNTDCISCEKGTYKDQEGPGECSLCPAGTFSITFGATTAATCTRCAVNTYSDTLGASDPSMCIDCPADTYSTVVGA